MTEFFERKDKCQKKKKKDIFTKEEKEGRMSSLHFITNDMCF